MVVFPSTIFAMARQARTGLLLSCLAFVQDSQQGYWCEMHVPISFICGLQDASFCFDCSIFPRWLDAVPKVEIFPRRELFRCDVHWVSKLLAHL